MLTHDAFDTGSHGPFNPTANTARVSQRLLGLALKGCIVFLFRSFTGPYQISFLLFYRLFYLFISGKSESDNDSGSNPCRRGGLALALAFACLYALLSDEKDFK